MLSSAAFALLLAVSSVPLGAAAVDSGTTLLKSARSRTFEFSYSTRVRGLPSSTVARVWLPVPHIDPDQEVKILAVDFPGQYQITREPEFGNQILYFESQPSRKGTLSFSIRYQITRRELMIETIRPIAAEDTSRFMQPDS